MRQAWMPRLLLLGLRPARPSTALLPPGRRRRRRLARCRHGASGRRGCRWRRRRRRRRRRGQRQRQRQRCPPQRLRRWSGGTLARAVGRAVGRRHARCLKRRDGGGRHRHGSCRGRQGRWRARSPARRGGARLVRQSRQLGQRRELCHLHGRPCTDHPLPLRPQHHLRGVHASAPPAATAVPVLLAADQGHRPRPHA